MSKGTHRAARRAKAQLRERESRIVAAWAAVGEAAAVCRRERESLGEASEIAVRRWEAATAWAREVAS